jgi:bla regulator protein blaR1
VDKTGLTGYYDFSLQFAIDPGMMRGGPGPAMAGPGGPPGGGASPPPDDASGPTLMTALQEQLGLRLESGKGPVDVLVVDHVEQPSAN